MSQSLNGLKVLDLSRILAGPLVGQILGDLGADVVKVERPGVGDDAREMGPPFFTETDGSKVAGFFLSCNRNKRSLAADLSNPSDLAMLRDLAREADVVIENFKVGTLARFGLDHATLAADNPDLVYCSITGFGQTGPYAAKPGYDGVFQAMSGLMSVSGHPDDHPCGSPMKVGVSMVDILTAYNGVIAILAALRHRDAGHGGQFIDLSLLDCGVASLSHFAQNYLITGEVPERRGNGGYGGIPSQAFACSDRMIFIVAGNNDQYRRLCDAIGHPELASDPRFSTGPRRIENRKLLIPLLDAVFKDRSAAEWVALIDAAGVPASVVNDVAQMFADPQVRERGLRTAADDGSMDLVANPLRLSATPVERYRRPPRLGEHTREVIADWLGSAPFHPEVGA
ncbi:CoA transferase [Sphingomonas sp. MG17]|uniref:CoA transferase n=1 Tax=Sphingomonas tagetis TaxID=2949092 RepID=A0A9X2HL82_9SPHN|nr:CoA transferase [Sphingomonas tagetis]MCP3731264.1 CoA transferase [Sphingomonas tagetis]